jgi:superfamily II DNA/RNA helicase
MSQTSYSSRSHRGESRSFSSYGGGRSNSGGNRRKSGKRQAAYIHPSRFVQSAKPREEVIYTPKFVFNDFAVNALIHENLENMGYTSPTAIQDQAIPHALEGKDVVGIANTGTGKTIAFGIPVLDKLMSNPESRAIIMAPTRELAQQIEDELRVVAKRSGIFGAMLIGGTPMGPQLRDLRANPQIVIGTPGRIKDHIERGSLRPEGFNIVVLDEVDRMLDMGFIDDMRDILERLASERQSLFFSATMEPKVAALIETFSGETVTISVKTGETSDNVEQDIMPYTSMSEKIEQLHTLLNREDVSKAIIFDETQRSVERLAEELMERGFKVDAIHGGKSQGQRQRALNKFKASQINVMVATDVAARGIDVKDISHVINYGQPQSYEDYVHRIGRAGRAGRIGYAYTFVQARY